MNGRTNSTQENNIGALIPLEPVTDLNPVGRNQVVSISWTDPVDKVASPGGEMVAQWDHTVIIRKEGSPPISVNDGTQLISTSTRDQYKETPFNDSDVANYTEYYYAAYAYNNYGVISEASIKQATPYLETLVYYGQVPSGLSAPTSMRAAATSNEKYGIFAGGQYYGTSSWLFSKTPTAYDETLTRSLATDLRTGTYNLSSTNIGKYAIFAGGTEGAEGINDANAYDDNLVRSNPTYGLTYTRESAAASNESYALFAGGFAHHDWAGYFSRDETYAFDSDLTGMNGPNMMRERTEASAVNIDEYILIAGGHNDDSNITGVDIYNSTLTKVSNSLSFNSTYTVSIPTASVGDYGIFGDYSAMNVYSSSLTRIDVEHFTIARSEAAGVGFSRYAVFTSGIPSVNAQEPSYYLTEVYDDSLVHTTMDALKIGRSRHSATAIGKFALFGGGNYSSTVVEAFTTE